MSAKIKIWDSRVKAIVLAYNKHKSQFAQKFCSQNRWHERGNLPSCRSQPSMDVSFPGDKWLVSSVVGKNDHFLAYLVNTIQWKEAGNCCFQKSQNSLGVDPPGIAVFTYSQCFKFSCPRNSSQCFAQMLESSNERPLTQARIQPDSVFLLVCAVSLYRETNLSLERGYLGVTVKLSRWGILVRIALVLKKNSQ